jgi:soluble lytic murein transglycosylase-like protein
MPLKNSYLLFILIPLLSIGGILFLSNTSQKEEAELNLSQNEQANRPVLVSQKPSTKKELLDFREPSKESQIASVHKNPMHNTNKPESTADTHLIKINEKLEKREKTLASLREKLLFLHKKEKTTQKPLVFKKAPIIELKRKNILTGRKKKYEGMVHTFAAKYGIDPTLILAIIEVESNFKPSAISHANAIGLMQVVSKSAGADVKNTMKIKEPSPTETNLKIPKVNIHYGTAYLWLLKNKYLKKIKDPRNKKYVAIASYNGGVSAALKAFSRSKRIAINKINSMHPNEVLRHLAKRHRSKETRNYVQKVALAHNKYSELLN